MKLILQECWFKWSLNQHHKNKRLLVQVASHTRLLRHFNVFGQRKQRRPQRRKTEDICLVAEVDYSIWLCKSFHLHISSKDSLSRVTSLSWLKGVTGQWTVNLPFTTVRPKKCSSLIPRSSSTRLKTSWPVDFGWSRWRNKSIHSQQKDCSTEEIWLEEGQGSRAVLL